MKRCLSLVLTLGFGCAAIPGAASADDAAVKIAEKVTTEGAAIFDTFDAPAMAATYDEQAVLTVFKKENGKVERDTFSGRVRIESEYAELFKNSETIKSRNIVENARLISPDVLTIDGTFDTNTLKPDSIKVPFHQVRQQRDGKWFVLSMEISLLPKG